MAPAPQALVDPAPVLALPLGHYAQCGVVEVGTPSLVQGVIQSERVLISVLPTVM